MAVFYTAVRKSHFDNVLSQSQVSGMGDLIKAAWSMSYPLEHTAYLLATVFHETGEKMQPISENLNYRAEGLLKTFKKYFTEDQAREYQHQPEKIANRAYANRMDNGSEASGDGWKYRGRGGVQITGRGMYRKFGIILNIPLEAFPDRALERDISIQIATIGMQRGTFTGKKLSDFIKPGKEPDYLNARQIINGMDAAAKIAAYARDFETALVAAGYVPAAKTNTPTSEPTIQAPEVQPVVIKVSSSTKPISPTPKTTLFASVIEAIASFLKGKGK